PVRPIHATHVNKPYVRLAHESRGLETLVRRFASHAPCSDSAQLVMNERNELPERGFVAAAPGQQQRRDVSWILWNSAILRVLEMPCQCSLALRARATSYCPGFSRVICRTQRPRATSVPLRKGVVNCSASKPRPGTAVAAVMPPIPRRIPTASVGIRALSTGALSTGRASDANM